MVRSRGRGELDGQRHAVQRAADPDNVRHRLRGRLEPGAGRGCAVGQQPHRGVGHRLGQVGAGRRQGERLHRPQRLAGDAERFPAGGEDA
jgi:hypothetical protein